jgi:hypothetical protein
MNPTRSSSSSPEQRLIPNVAADSTETGAAKIQSLLKQQFIESGWTRGLGWVKRSNGFNPMDGGRIKKMADVEYFKCIPEYKFSFAPKQLSEMECESEQKIETKQEDMEISADLVLTFCDPEQPRYSSTPLPCYSTTPVASFDDIVSETPGIRSQSSGTVDSSDDLDESLIFKMDDYKPNQIEEIKAV